MDTEKYLQQAEEILSPFSKEFTRPETFRLDAIIPVESLIPAVQAMTDSKWGYISAITGLDKPTPAPAEPVEAAFIAENHIEILYHFCEKKAITTLRVTIPYSNPVIPTVCGVVPLATLYERELIEMFGITITDTPNTDKLLLPDDWPAGVYPLRKEFTGFATKPVEGEGERS